MADPTPETAPPPGLLKARLALELSEALIRAALDARLATLDLPLEIPALRLELGRLRGGRLSEFRLEPGLARVGLEFASGPTAELAVRLLQFLPETQTLRLRVERLHFAKVPGAALLNLAPGRVLDVAAAQANRRLPGLAAVKGMELELDLRPLVRKALEEAPLRRALKERLGLEPTPDLAVRELDFLEGAVGVSLQASL